MLLACFRCKMNKMILTRSGRQPEVTGCHWMGAGEVFLTREMNSVVHSTSGPHYLNGNCLQETTNFMPFLGLSVAYYHFKGQTEIVRRDKQGCCDRIIFSRMTCRISTIRTSEHGSMTLLLFFFLRLNQWVNSVIQINPNPRSRNPPASIFLHVDVTFFFLQDLSRNVEELQERGVWESGFGFVVSCLHGVHVHGRSVRQGVTTRIDIGPKPHQALNPKPHAPNPKP